MKKIILVLFVMLASVVNAQNAQNSQVSEYRMVSLFVYNFARNIHWPVAKAATANNTFEIGVWGNSPFYDEAVKFMADKKIGNQSIVVRKITDIKKINECNLLFISPERNADLNKLSVASASSSVLLVTLQNGTSPNNPGINLFIDNQDNKMKFEIKKTAINSKNLKVSKNLEDLAYHND